MLTPLEKARRDPGSMKGKILRAARRIFGEYGYHGTTTRMIAQEVGIDISTLHYHWGEKGDLYEAVIFDINEDLRQKLAAVENRIHGRPLKERMDIAIDLMTEYLFDCPEISNLILFRYFGKTRHDAPLDIQVPEFLSGIARSMNLCKDRNDVSTSALLKILAMMNAIHNFISGENFFRPMLGLDKEAYVVQVKETLKFMLIPPFTKGCVRNRESGVTENLDDH
jgi:TetR/AcrR family transcriptional regulator, regulator of cefoperazone and chloramphenicol sensitivity